MRVFTAAVSSLTLCSAVAIAQVRTGVPPPPPPPQSASSALPGESRGSSDAALKDCIADQKQKRAGISDKDAKKACKSQLKAQRDDLNK
jgi:hypothetical protein